jgi:hypothetical protein
MACPTFFWPVGSNGCLEMLSQVNHWLDFAATAIDLLLLLRVVTLKLHRTYFFIALACLLSVFFDGVALWLGPDSDENLRVFLYSRFLYAFVYPVAAWDVFEEFTPHLAKLRRLAISRTITSLVLITLFGLALSAFLASGNDADDSVFLKTLAIFVWTGSAAASLSFLWVMHKEMRAQKLSPPRNTFVWLVFYELVLLGEIVSCFVVQISSMFSAAGKEILTLALLSYGMSVTVWCAIKLRALPREAPSEPAGA